jgi:hypothetical protein
MIRSLVSRFEIRLPKAILTCLFAMTIHAAADQDIKATEAVGWFKSSQKPFRLVCRVNAAGGFRELYVFRGNDPVFYARDVTAYLWQNGKVIYSASPLYGKSGIFIIDPSLEIQSTVIDGARNEYIVLQTYNAASHRVKYETRPLDTAKHNDGPAANHEVEVSDL